ncbi:MAG: DUF5820 family protein [Haloferacaceae archaeon]
MSFPAMPSGWVVWADESGGRGVLTYRPDVFDSQEYPAPCLPTIYVTNGSQRARPGAGQRQTSTWNVKLFVEPDVEGETETYDTREAAAEGAVELARRFADGEVDYRSLYHVPREDYLDRLDELTGRDS